MADFPHYYSVTVKGAEEQSLKASSPGLPELEVAPPAQFNGPGDVWSPEDLFMASIANCLILSFRAIARASKFDWVDITCESTGELDHIDRETRFTKVKSEVVLTVPEGASKDRAKRLVEKAEKACLITNSINAEVSCSIEVITESS